MPSKSTLEDCLTRYSASLSLQQTQSRASTLLLDLDGWYRTELRSELNKRRDVADGELYLEKAELEHLMKWKLSRGKWRPRLASLIASNSPTAIRAATSCSSSRFPLKSATEAKSLLDQLCQLKGVGPATASAILAAYDPTNEPFMSDQALEFVESRNDTEVARGKRDYTVKAWQQFRTKMQERKEGEGWESVEKLEMALFSWGIEQEHGRGPVDPELSSKAVSNQGASLKVEGKRKAQDPQVKTSAKKRKST